MHDAVSAAEDMAELGLGGALPVFADTPLGDDDAVEVVAPSWPVTPNTCLSSGKISATGPPVASNDPVEFVITTKVSPVSVSYMASDVQPKI